LGQAVKARRPGDVVKVVVLRGGRRQDISVALAENVDLRGIEFFGVRLDRLPPEDARELDVQEGMGMRVTAVDPRGSASGSLQEGDVIVSVSQTARSQAWANAGTLKKLEQSVKHGGRGQVTVLRPGYPYPIVITIR
jgi:S1-C subfamily serine protease